MSFTYAVVKFGIYAIHRISITSLFFSSVSITAVIEICVNHQEQFVHYAVCTLRSLFLVAMFQFISKQTLILIFTHRHRSKTNAISIPLKVPMKPNFQ